VNLWLRECRTDSTRRQYADEYRRFADWYRGALIDLTRDHLYRYMEALVHMRNLGVTSVRKVMHIIRGLLSYGHTTGVLPLNVGAKLNMPRPKDTLTERILTQEQVHAIIAASDNPLMIRTLYLSGIRRAELIGLTWADVQEAHGRGQLTVYGKGQKTRTVGIPKRLYDDLHAIRRVSGPVFTRPDGGRLSPEQVHRAFKRAAIKAGLPQASPHWMRHAHASASLEAGAPLPLVQRDLGHTSTATTGKYLHARPGDACSDYLEDK